MTHLRPRPPLPASRDHTDWRLDPAFPRVVQTTEEWNALPYDIRRYVLADWVWCMNHDAMRGAGLFPHYGFLVWDALETEEEKDWVPGVTLNGCGVRRSEFLYGA